MDAAFLAKFFIYASALNGVFSANKYIIEVAAMLVPDFKHKKTILSGVEILTLIFFWVILLKSFNRFDWD